MRGVFLLGGAWGGVLGIVVAIAVLIAKSPAFIARPLPAPAPLTIPAESSVLCLMTRMQSPEISHVKEFPRSCPPGYLRVIRVETEDGRAWGGK